MRIVAGRFRARPLAAPATGDRTLRPTSDRLRETLFNMLEHGDAPLEGARVLDLFAGTGALGLEALSRGARFCLFVEEAAPARALIRRNVEALQLTGVIKIFRRDAARLGPAGAIAPFDLVFLDPPYGRGLAQQALSAAREGGWLAPGALIVVEESADAGFTAPEGFAEQIRRRQGGSQLVFLTPEKPGA